MRDIWPSPAKINLFLHVVGKRPDGYHDLQTVFQLLDFGDEMTFEVNKQGEIVRNYDYGFSVSQDICLKAAQLLKSVSNSDCGVTIGLDKRLPMGGGLGGGSSNAATTLIALNALWKTGLSRQELAELGLQLGADVPVFIFGQTAWAEGVGEQLKAMDLPQRWYLIMNPNICVSTAAIFAHKHLTPSAEMMTIRAFQEGHGDNQLESIVRAEYSQVDALLNWLSQFGQPRMSGSGGSVFLPLDNESQGLEILAAKPDNTTGFVAQSLHRHPLYAMLSDESQSE